ncbi:hypothetical protein CERZMDRAFT_80220 [Cercospora zeae-maydis SCOH1-5]|uniref:Uncharacterized protein n=1 Tax=Cercospora zeae-maydis SCOH1-5 TaxID=717836 RepID=A0A6A6FW56_9PEZI|nr:hypothetical protein CERZMDRAFT_80220 [Cercospora zeae-maydis SCOH1-5]
MVMPVSLFPQSSPDSRRRGTDHVASPPGDCLSRRGGGGNDVQAHHHWPNGDWLRAGIAPEGDESMLRRLLPAAGIWDDGHGHAVSTAAASKLVSLPAPVSSFPALRPLPRVATPASRRSASAHACMFRYFHSSPHPTRLRALPPVRGLRHGPTSSTAPPGTLIDSTAAPQTPKRRNVPPTPAMEVEAAAAAAAAADARAAPQLRRAKFARIARREVSLVRAPGVPESRLGARCRQTVSTMRVARFESHGRVPIKYIKYMYCTNRRRVSGERYSCSG